MKLRIFGRVCLALAASLVLVGGMDSCTYDYTVAYVFVTGSQYNQVASYREDNDTGQLLPAPNDPQSSGGSDPIRAVLLTSGRYLYVLNHGTPTVGTDGTITWTGGNISLFSVGGDGGLAFQQTYPSQGNGSVRLSLSAGGNFLYVLDEYEPSGTAGTTAASATATTQDPCYDASTGYYRPVGDVTVYSIDANTGRLYLVPNQEQTDASGTDLTYFPLGCNPIDFYEGSGYLYTAEVSDPSNPTPNGPAYGGEVVYAYQAASTGQLLPAPNGSQIIKGATNLTVISGDASWVFLLDSGTNEILEYTTGSNGLLAATTGGVYTNSGALGMNAMTTDASGKFLYIANTESTALGQPNSAITAYIIAPASGNLSPVNEEPFKTGSGPQCIFEDPSHQYVYTANSAASTFTGFELQPQTGILASMSHGSTFSTVGTPTWCLYSANTD